MMEHLLDTHVLIWARARPEKLGSKTQALLRSTDLRFHLSAITSLELAQLAHKNKLVLPCAPKTWMREAFQLLGCVEIPVTTEIASDAYDLPGQFHPDPADRILVATARCHSFTLITADERILDYPQVSTWDARK
jgi:PIN domain nuclease of toxin-antitoxin system